jgi:tetratricopeptide (TPR) repeat protein
MSLKKILFKVIAIGGAFFVLLLVELILRWCGYGHTTALFVQDPDDPTCWVMNPYASARYFSDTANETRGNIEPFKIDKAPNTCRIFVLGESTTAGYPYMHNGSFHRWLQYRLMHTFPDRRFEVVNVSLTAVNSYTVLDFGREVLRYKPDAVLVYVGHNEYYGALGVGSTSLIASNRFLVRTVLALRQLRLVQLLSNGVRALKSHHIDARENLMKRVAAKQEIAYGSDDYNTGIAQFRANMNDLCASFAAAHVPLFLSTVVSNERDQRPFISAPRGSAGSADSAYQAGNAAFAAGDYVTARAAYIRAKELDLLRFRAPEAINGIISDLTHQYPYVHLVDTRALFEAHSPHGIPGSETLLEHVHPNLYGYALLSEAFYQAMKQQHLITPDSAREIPFATLLAQMPVTRVDSLYGAYRIIMLKAGWPFNEPIPAGYKRGNSPEEAIAGALSVDRITWMDAMDQLFKYYIHIGDKADALKATEAVLLEHPSNALYYIYAGRLDFDLGRYDDAVLYFKRAYALEPSAAHAENIALLFLKIDQPQQALDYITQSGAGSPDLSYLKNMTQEIVGLKDAFRTDATNIELRRQLAMVYTRVGAEEAAAKYLH